MTEQTTKRLGASAADIAEAARLLRAGKLVGMPTETVYGLAANALDNAAVLRIFEAKGRPADNPLIVHISDIGQWQALVTGIPPVARRLAEAFWPGPLTVILPRSEIVPPAVSAGLDTVAVRFPVHPVARALIDACGFPLAAPSGNRSGSPSPTTARHMLDDMDGRIAAVIDGGECQVGVESTVVSLTGDVPRVLRPGGITPEQICVVAGAAAVDEAVLNPLGKTAVAASPGMKYKHYAPRARVSLVRADGRRFAEFVNAQPRDGLMPMGFGGEEGDPAVPYLTYGRRDQSDRQAQRLFDALRELDARGATRALVSAPDPEGVGLAVYNRLLRAAGFEVIDLA